jgi:hypothetical protein
MKVRHITRAIAVVLVCVAASRITAWLASAQTLPADAQSTCTVTTGGAPAFNTWFESGTVTANGVVKPADSLNFPDNPNCSFYQWSYQMFLWATSPAPLSYGGGGGRIFESPAFFDVSPLDADLNRTFIPHTNRLTKILSVRAAQVGRHGLPVIMDKRGRMFEIEEPKKATVSGKALVLNSAGRQVEIERMSLTADRKPVFMDKAGRRIAAPRAIVRPNLDKTRVVQRFIIDKIPVFIDPFGHVIDTEVGQADGGVLLAQNGSLIYYITSVNDVYAYFLTGTKNGGITPKPTQFPTTAASLAKVTAFASAHGKTFPDPEALAVEVKTAWIEATGISNPGDYITIQGTIPTYDKTDPNHWVPTGQKTTQLAMVGMHVVGSTKGHPEMIWATFEHFGNAPNAAYTYNATVGPNPKTVAQNTAGTWLFAANGTSGPFNQMHQQNPQGTNDIFAISPFAIGPSDTIRFKPFGGASNAAPNPVGGPPTPTTAAKSNTEIISINNNVLGQLLAGDIRKNYYMTGSTWTIGGAAPTSNWGNPGNSGITAGKAVGTSQLANTTMETYQQVDTLFNQFGNNCFSCHVTNTVSVSHMFCTPGAANCSKGLKPLFP